MRFVAMNTSRVVVNGDIIATENTGKAMLTELYRQHVGDYPKFYKMDCLCQMGLVSSELLLQTEGEERFLQREDRAVVLFNKTSSLEADSRFQTTINDVSNYYPSPSVFVYTLPNIVTGEIAIRNKYFGETSFYVLRDFNPMVLAHNIACAFADEATNSVLSGWVDCTDENHFECIMFLVGKQDALDERALATEINTIYNVIK